MAYLLATIFFVAPLAFSHFFLLFRVPIVFDRFGNYEGPKLAIITVLLIFAAVFLIVDSVKKMPFQKYFGLMIAGITSISIWIIHGIF